MAITFQARGNPRLARRGLLGPAVSVTVSPAGLHLRGAEGGELAVPLARIGAISVSSSSSKSRVYYEARLTLPDGPPVTLMPLDPDQPLYAAALRSLAAALAAEGRLGILTVGGDRFLALFAPAALALVSAGAIRTALAPDPYAAVWQRAIIPAVPLIVTAFLLWFSVTRLWPRPLKNLAALNAYLPQ